MAKSAIREYIEAFIIAVALALFVITFIAQSFLVQGTSMEPSLHDGQRLMVDKLTYRFVEPKRGEIVVFGTRRIGAGNSLKVVGLPGDEISIRNGYLYINGQRIIESSINGPTYGAYGSPVFGPVVVPEDSYFVMGDNRRNSDDSRYPDVGFVHRSDIVGLARFVYWPVTQIQVLRIPSGYSQ